MVEKPFLCSATSAKGTEFQKSGENSREFPLGNTAVCRRIGNMWDVGYFVLVLLLDTIFCEIK